MKIPEYLPEEQAEMLRHKDIVKEHYKYLKKEIERLRAKLASLEAAVDKIPEEIKLEAEIEGDKQE